MSDIDEEEEDEDQEDVQEVVMLHPFVAWFSLNASRLNRYNFPTDNAIDFLIWAPSPPKRFAYLTCKALSEQCCYELFLGLGSGCGKLVHGVMGGTPCAGFAVLTCR